MEKLQETGNRKEENGENENSCHGIVAWREYGGRGLQQCWK